MNSHHVLCLAFVGSPKMLLHTFNVYNKHNRTFSIINIEIANSTTQKYSQKKKNENRGSQCSNIKGINTLNIHRSFACKNKIFYKGLMQSNWLYQMPLLLSIHYMFMFKGRVRKKHLEQNFNVHAHKSTHLIGFCVVFFFVST